VDRTRVERTIHWLQTWIQDLIRMKLAGEARHHPQHAEALRARARAADVEALFALDRDLTEARRLSMHPLNPRLVAEHLLMAYNRATSGAPR
jgi:DNA polymerase III subunit delta'